MAGTRTPTADNRPAPRCRPKAKRVTLRGATIHDEPELDDWLAEARAEIETALA